MKTKLYMWFPQPVNGGWGGYRGRAPRNSSSKISRKYQMRKPSISRPKREQPGARTVRRPIDVQVQGEPERTYDKLPQSAVIK